MSIHSKICEHETVKWIFKKIPKVVKTLFIKNTQLQITSFDVNASVFIIGTDIGYIYLLSRNSSSMDSLLLRKNSFICNIKIIQTIDLLVAFGTKDGSIFILKIPVKDEIILSEINQFIVPVEHHSSITYMTWSKNSEKLFTGDSNGLICCTEIHNINKSVSSYHVCEASSKIIQLSYSNNCLIVSTELENFIYNLSTYSRTTVGRKPRNKGDFGACFLEKLCRPEEVEIAFVRQDSKVWISDINGLIKRTILLKNETLFSVEKSITLLPCVTSQSNVAVFENRETGVSKYQLGLIISLGNNEVLFWSKDGLIIFNILDGKIISSTCNLGIILSVSVCHVNVMMDSESEPQENKKLSNNLLEIWILRKPIRDDESTLVRLSMLPLEISKLTIDPFYKHPQCENLKSLNRSLIDIPQENLSELPKIVKESVIVKNENETVPNNKAMISEKWLPKFEINVSDTIQDMRTNVQEITRKTKEIIKQSQEIFENTNEGIEQALELTEEGLIIEFDGTLTDDKNISDIIVDPNLEIKVEDQCSNDNIFINSKKKDRKINFINLDNNYLDENPLNFRSVIDDYPIEHQSAENVKENPLNFPSVIDDYSIEHQSAEDVICSATQMMNTERLWSVEESKSPDMPELFEPSNLYEELFPFVKDEGISNQLNETMLSLTSDKYVNEGIINKDNLQNNVVETKEIHENFPKSNSPNTLNIKPLDVRASLVDTDIKHSSCPNIITNEFLENFCHSPSQKDIKDISLDTEIISDNFYDSQNIINSNEKPILTNKILSSCTKWISHRGPTLSGYNKITSLSINRRMIWLSDTKGCLHVGFRNYEDRSSTQDFHTENSYLQWHNNSTLNTDKIYSSPEGVILWRDKSREISVYTGITKIWTPKVVMEKVLLKSNWEQTMLGIKDIDIDNDMAVIVTIKGQLKVMNGISGRVSYKQSCTACLTGHVTLATTLNGIIWCITEIVEPETKIASQHIFACLAKDDDEKLNISYWRTVPTPKDLVAENENHLGILAGSCYIKSIQLGACGLAWILTLYDSCFFSSNISAENPTGDGVWYQISMNFLSQISTSNDETRIKKTSSNTNTSFVLISVKAFPKGSRGNGLIWLTSTERNSPCILFESDKDILGHGWLDCFSNETKRNSITSLPPILIWLYVSFGFKNVIWLVNNCNEIFCYWKESHIRNIVMPSCYGKVVQIAAHGASLLILTHKSCILARIGITANNVTGNDWAEINNSWNVNKEVIKYITCFDNEIWLVTTEKIFYNENLRSLMINVPKKNPWKSFDFKLNESSANTFSIAQVSLVTFGKKYIWAVSDPDGYIYFGVWNISKQSCKWTYIPGPRAKSIHVSEENIWIVEQLSSEIYVRCGINLAKKATGDYWIHVPISSGPVNCLSAASNNDIVVIDCKRRLLSHTWTIIKGNGTEETLSLHEIRHDKLLEGDWELLN